MPIADDFSAIARAMRDRNPEPPAAAPAARKLRARPTGRWKIVVDGQEIGLCDEEPLLVVPPDVCVLVSDWHAAPDARRRHPGAHITWPGASTIGRRFARIVLEHDPAPGTREHAWLQEALLTRLMPRGVVERLAVA